MSQNNDNNEDSHLHELLEFIGAAITDDRKIKSTRIIPDAIFEILEKSLKLKKEAERKNIESQFLRNKFWVALGDEYGPDDMTLNLVSKTVNILELPIDKAHREKIQADKISLEKSEQTGE